MSEDQSPPVQETIKTQPEEIPENKPQVLQRRYKENMSFFSDLFKLNVASMLQWKGYQEITKDAPLDENGNLNEDWFHTEHCHWFHTFDSNGKEQFYTPMIGQHCHKIEIKRDPSNPEDILSFKVVGPPLKWIITKKYGKRQKILSPDPHDTHTHEMEYKKTNKLSRPDINSEAVKVIGNVQSHSTSKAVYDEHGKPLGNLEVR